MQKPRLTTTATPVKACKGPISPVQELHQASAFLDTIQKFHTDKTFLQRLCMQTLYTTIIIFAMGQVGSVHFPKNYKPGLFWESPPQMQPLKEFIGIVDDDKK